MHNNDRHLYYVSISGFSWYTSSFDFPAVGLFFIYLIWKNTDDLANYIAGTGTQVSIHCITGECKQSLCVPCKTSLIIVVLEKSSHGACRSPPFIMFVQIRMSDLLYTFFPRGWYFKLNFITAYLPIFLGDSSSLFPFFSVEQLLNISAKSNKKCLKLQ